VIIRINAEVRCADGARGQCTHVIADPTTGELTHLVVKANWPPRPERLVPMEQVVETTSELVRLRCTADELRSMDAFVTTQYVEATRPAYYYESKGVYALPHELSVEERILVPETVEQVPAGELALRRGARVEATDKPIGRVDELILDPKSHRVTHLVLREGHLWGQKEVTIPVSEIALVEEDTVRLKLDAKSVEALPATSVRRPLS
jgi:sporulation protein YlmC with PRC-barrel domain